MARKLNEYTDARDAVNENSIEETQLALAEAYEFTASTEEELTNTQMALAEVFEMLTTEGE